MAKPTQKQVTKAVRNITANELGLTREAVAKEVEIQVDQYIAEAIQKIDIEKFAQQAVLKYIDQKIAVPNQRWAPMPGVNINRVISERIREIIDSKIEINVSTKG